MACRFYAWAAGRAGRSKGERRRVAPAGTLEPAGQASAARCRAPTLPPRRRAALPADWRARSGTRRLPATTLGVGFAQTIARMRPDPGAPMRFVSRKMQPRSHTSEALCDSEVWDLTRGIGACQELPWVLWVVGQLECPGHRDRVTSDCAAADISGTVRPQVAHGGDVKLDSDLRP